MFAPKIGEDDFQFDGYIFQMSRNHQAGYEYHRIASNMCLELLLARPRLSRQRHLKSTGCGFQLFDPGERS